MSQAPYIGLSAVEAAARLKSDGYNELPRAERRGVLRIAAACAGIGAVSLIALEALKAKWFRLATSNDELASSQGG